MKKKTRHRGKLLAFLTLHILTCINVAVQIVVIFLSTQVSLFPSQESLQSMVSSFAEILAGLYGITMAGYTFFLSRIDALTASDATLEFVVSGIKRKYKYLIWHITYQVAMTLMFTALLLLLPMPDRGKLSFLYRLFCNEFLVFLGFSVVLILYYSISVINPKSIEKEARKQKLRLCDSDRPGNAVEFITVYDRIEKSCRELLPEAAERQLRENKGSRFDLILDLLREVRPELSAMMPDLEKVYHYYACMMSCSPLTASADMCDLAKQVLEGLAPPEIPEEAPLEDEAAVACEEENTSDDGPM